MAFPGIYVEIHKSKEKGKRREEEERRRKEVKKEEREIGRKEGREGRIFEVFGR